MGLRGPKSANQATLTRIFPERPKPPRYLPKPAKSLWKEIIGSLPSDYFRTAELFLLEKYVVAHCIYRRAMERVNEDGSVIVCGDKGYQVVSPYLTIANKQVMIMSTLATKLRLCPNSRITKWRANTPERVKSKRPGLMFGEGDED